MKAKKKKKFKIWEWTQDLRACFEDAPNTLYSLIQFLLI